MPRFNEDKYREEVLGEFLETQLYPYIAREFERESSVEKQKVGHDLRIEFNWLSEPVIVDEKAQNSDRWINDPCQTFVMEIFGESWVNNDEVDWNLGWFVDRDNETEYYVLVWLPDVSLFKLTDIPGKNPGLIYQPATAVEFEPEAITEHISDTRTYTMDSSKDDSRDKFRVEFTPDVIRAFNAEVEPLPEIFTGNGKAGYCEWYYDPKHVYEAKIAIVEKEGVINELKEDGLTRDVLVDMGEEAIERGKVNIDSEKAKHIKRSGGKQSGSGDGENPVNIVVEYDTYHNITDKTFHYKNNSFSENIPLF